MQTLLHSHSTCSVFLAHFMCRRCRQNMQADRTCKHFSTRFLHVEPFLVTPQEMQTGRTGKHVSARFLLLVSCSLHRSHPAIQKHTKGHVVSICLWCPQFCAWWCVFIRSCCVLPQAQQLDVCRLQHVGSRQESVTNSLKNGLRKYLKPSK